MDKTNYPLLSIVAIVAITAVVAMFLSARVDGGITPLSEGAAITANALLDVPITGMVASEPAPPAKPARTVHRFDFNEDGSLSEKDAVVLGHVIDRVQFCPRNTQCDVNSDDFVDIQNLGAVNAILLREAPPAPQPPAPTPVYAAPQADDSLAVGTYGAVA